MTPGRTLPTTVLTRLEITLVGTLKNLRTFRAPRMATSATVEMVQFFNLNTAPTLVRILELLASLEFATANTGNTLPESQLPHPTF